MNEFPYVAPPPDGLQRAFADARGRRLRKAGLSTGTVAAALSALALVAGGQGTQSLVQQPAPQQPAVSHLLPHDRQAPQDAPRPNQGGTVRTFAGAPVTSGSTRQAPAPGTRVVAPPAVSDRHAAPRAVAPYRAGAVTRNDNDGTYLPDPTCPMPSTNPETPQLCTYAVLNSQASPAPYQMAGQVCSAGTSLALLHFAGRNEVDMTVTRNGKEVWRWSRWHPDSPYAHTISVAGGQCTDWTFDWTGVDAQGKKLPAGSYTLHVTFLAAELTNRSATCDFGIS